MAKNDSNIELALSGTLVIASAICVRLWLIMGDIDNSLNDPHAMAFIITDSGIKSDSASAEDQLAKASSSFADTEKMLAVFSVCLAVIAEVYSGFRLWL